MKIRNLIADDDAVSPVIGVILMVAITVILAAVIGTFVLGLGDQVQNTAPQASFTFDYEAQNADASGCAGSADAGDGLLTITHDGGDSITATNVDLVGSSAAGTTNEANPANLEADCSYGTSDDVTAGDDETLRVANDDTIRVTWEASSGGDTATLGRWDGPEA